jgi:hypothetical protein
MLANIFHECRFPAEVVESAVFNVEIQIVRINSSRSVHTLTTRNEGNLTEAMSSERHYETESLPAWFSGYPKKGVIRS